LTELSFSGGAQQGILARLREEVTHAFQEIDLEVGPRRLSPAIGAAFTPGDLVLGSSESRHLVALPFDIMVTTRTNSIKIVGKLWTSALH
jgi:hypothetical protein